MELVGSKTRAMLCAVMAAVMIMSAMPLIALSVDGRAGSVEAIEISNSSGNYWRSDTVNLAASSESNGLETKVGAQDKSTPYISPMELPVGTSGNITNQFLKDLTVSNITLENELIVCGYETTLRATVNSTEPMLSDPVDVGFYLDSIDEGHMIAMTNVTFETYSLNVSVNGTPEEPGLHNLYVVIDPYNACNESNETNNVLSIAVEVVDVGYLVEKAESQADNIKDYINSTLNPCIGQHLKVQLDLVKSKLDAAQKKYDCGNVPKAIQEVNLAAAKVLFLMDQIDDLRNTNKISNEEADTLIAMLTNLADTVINAGCVMNYSVETWQIATTEHLLVEVIVGAHLQIPGNASWNAVDAKLKGALNEYQKAMIKMAKGKDYSDELQSAYEKLLDARDKIEKLMEKGKIPTDFGNWAIEKINNILYIFPPDLAVSMSDINIKGNLIVGESNNITVTVRNLGFVSPSNVKVEVYDDPRGEEGALIHSATLSRVLAKGQAALDFQWTPITKGVHYIKV